MALPLFSNKAKSTLAQTLAPAATTVYLAAGEGALFPSPTAGYFFPLWLIRASDSAVELTYCTARTSDTLTITRAQEGTTGLAFIVGDRAQLRMSADTYEMFAIDATLTTALDARTFAIATGTADALVATLSPVPAALVDGMEVRVRALYENATTTPTLNLNSLGVKTIVRNDGAPLIPANIAGPDHELILRYNATSTEWALLNPALGVEHPANPLYLSQHFT